MICSEIEGRFHGNEEIEGPLRACFWVAGVITALLTLWDLSGAKRFVGAALPKNELPVRVRLR